MTPPLRAAVVAVGTELVADGRPDGNGVAISRLLAARGVATAVRAQVPDDEEELARVLVELSARHPLVLVTGGLGPTLDDVTREAVARAFHLTLEEDGEVLKGIEARFQARGRAMPPRSRRQAMVPRGAEVMPNAAGTAPGLVLSPPGNGRIFLLPGVPHEMQRMMVEQVLPRLEPLAGSPLAWRGFRTAGLTEVQVQERIEDLLADPGAAAMTILASPGEVTVIFRGDDPRAIDRLARQAVDRLGAHVISEDLSLGLEDVVGDLLLRRRMTLATAESCTGGLLGSLITRVAGSSAWFLQGWITYADEAKSTALGVSGDLLRAHGAVSEAVAREMASAALRRSGASRALSITGIAGPAGGSDDKPVGLVFIGLASAQECSVTRHLFPGDRETIRLFAARSALDRLRRELLGGEAPA